MTGGTISVTGGTGGVSAHFDDLLAVARVFDLAADDLDETLDALRSCTLDDRIREAERFDPFGAMDFRAALAKICAGPWGERSVADAFRANARALRGAVALYRVADRGHHGLLSGIAGLLTSLPRALVVGQAAWIETGSASLAAQLTLTADPAILDQVVDIVDVPGLDATLGHLEPDGHAAVSDLGPDERVAAMNPPRSLADLVTGLALRDQGRAGEVDVKLVAGGDGRRRAIVDIPGTKSWDPQPNPDITSLSTNVRALVGQPTAYAQGVLTAMARAGVRPSDEVMLVGHSEGGMVAVEVAKRATTSGRFDVTHVLTAGSPIGLTVGGLPARVQVLALENATDVVPEVDGRPNPDRRNITTVTVHHGNATIVDDHSLTMSYEPGAADVDSSDNPSVRAYVTGASGFLTGTQVQTTSYLITRAF